MPNFCQPGTTYVYSQNEQLLVTECYRMEQLEFKLEKIIGI